jgi:hypothetical protein
MRRVFVALILLTTSRLACALDPATLLKEADRARGGHLPGLTWDLDVVSREGEDEDQRSLFLQSLQRNTRVEYTAPAKSKGQLVLMRDRNMWFSRPGLQKPVSISPRQRLSGQASNGDIASTDYSGDYAATLANEEVIAGDRCAILDLVAKSKNTTYDRIRYWISINRKVGVKAEFLTVSGKLFKTASFEYDNRIHFEGQQYPFVSRMTISDAINPSHVSILTYRNVKVKGLNPAIFESTQ